VLPEECSAATISGEQPPKDKTRKKNTYPRELPTSRLFVGIVLGDWGTSHSRECNVTSSEVTYVREVLGRERAATPTLILLGRQYEVVNDELRLSAEKVLQGFLGAIKGSKNVLLGHFLHWQLYNGENQLSSLSG
jgi:hypothetical protein